MKKCWVFSNCEFNLLMEKNGWSDDNIPEDCAFISICDEDWEKMNEPDISSHWFKQNHDNVINLEFADIADYTYKNNPNIHGMSDEQAQNLYAFIKKNIGKDFYIHCAAGISRSQGVAKFIVTTYHDVYTEESLRIDNPCEFPNLHVLSLLRHLWFDDNN